MSRHDQFLPPPQHMTCSACLANNCVNCVDRLLGKVDRAVGCSCKRPEHGSSQ